MFDLEGEIKAWRAELTRSGIKTGEVLDELEAHLREQIGRLRQSEATDAEKFRTAVSRLGDAKILKKEFVKARNRNVFGYRNNPLGLKILAFWFIIMGLNSLSCLRMLFHIAFVPQPLAFPPAPVIALLISFGLCLFYGLQLALGIGLLHRKNFCRTMGLGWTAMSLVLCAWDFVHSCFDSKIPFQYGMSSIVEISVKGSYWVFLGIPFRMAVMDVFGLVNLAMLFWGLYLLTTPPVKNLFRRAT